MKEDTVWYWLTALLAAVGLLLGASFCWADGPGATTLTWQDNAINEVGVDIERAPALCDPVPTTFAKIGEVGTNVTTYVDTTTVTGGKYCYRVRAWNLAYSGDMTSIQYSPYSNLAGIGFPFPAPAAPGQLTIK